MFYKVIQVKYPTTPSLRAYLDDLYGAGFYVDVTKKGEYHIISFTVDIVNEKFLSDPTPLLEKAFAFFQRFFFIRIQKETLLTPQPLIMKSDH